MFPQLEWAKNNPQAVSDPLILHRCFYNIHNKSPFLSDRKIDALPYTVQLLVPEEAVHEILPKLYLAS